MLTINSKLYNNLRRSSYNLFQCRTFCNQNENKSLVEESKKFNPKNLRTKNSSKLPARQPLVKNLFLGNVDKELLAFPEVISRDSMSELYKEIKGIEYTFQNNMWEIQNIKDINEEILSNLVNAGLLGLNVAQIYNGKEYNWSESLISSQYEIKQTNIATFLLPHRIVCDIINIHGTEEQKKKYLTKLASGSLIGSDAILEVNNAHNEFFSTIAEYDPEVEMYTLKGEKAFLTTGSKADVFLVLAETSKMDFSGNFAKGITLFIVELKLSGVIVRESQNSLDHTIVSFQNVRLTSDNIIGKVNEGAEAAQLLFQNNRIRSSYVGLGIMKNMLNKAVNYAIETKHCGVELSNVESIKTSLSKILCKAYAIESMIYFTAGLLDEFEKQDIEIESAILKLFTSESLWSSTISIMDCMGSKYLQPEHKGEQDIKHIFQLCTQGESIDSIRLFIALSGLRHAGMSLQESVTKNRNPLFHPGYILNKFFQPTNIKIPKTSMLLNQHLHPSLEAAAQNLEHSIYRLQACTEMLLMRYGNDIIEKHSEIKRLTEMAMLIYATFASLARSSRSYCIGLKLGDYEMLIAAAIALDARDRIRELSTEIEEGPFITNDKNYERISKQLIQSKGYFSENPLKFNF